MKMSCNGCRVLRKACSGSCLLKTCLQWIPSPESQANATVFLAKFYGRTGLVNLINAGKPPRLRQAIFRSLLYEACGRIVNPVYGSVGLLESGKWQLCQDAVEAVLKGVPIEKIAASDAPALKGCDIRHVCKKDKKQFSGAMALNRVRPSSRFKRSGACQQLESEEDRSPSHGSTLSHQSAAAEITERESACRSSQGTDVESGGENDVVDIELDLSLGLGPVKAAVKPKAIAACGGACEMELGLHPQPS